MKSSSALMVLAALSACSVTHDADPLDARCQSEGASTISQAVPSDDAVWIEYEPPRGNSSLGSKTAWLGLEMSIDEVRAIAEGDLGLEILEMSDEGFEAACRSSLGVLNVRVIAGSAELEPFDVQFFERRGRTVTGVVLVTANVTR